MVAAGGRLDHLGHAAGLQPGEHERGLHLRAGNRQVVLAAGEVTAAHDERGELAAGTPVDTRTHRAEGLGDTPHRPAAQRRVAGEHRQVGPPGDQAGEHPHGAPGVGAVDHVVGLVQRRRAPSLHEDGAGVALDRHAEPAECPPGPGDVVTTGEADDSGTTLGERGEEQRAVGDALVPRDPQPPAQGRRAVDPEPGREAHRSGVRAVW